MFAQPVNPVRDGCPNYFKIVKNPMDLGTVMKKLTENQYKSVAEWKADVNLVWSNSLLYNSKNVLLNLITKDLSEFFQKLTVNLSDSVLAGWNDQLQSLLQEMNGVMRDMPAIDKRTKQKAKSKPKSKPRPITGTQINKSKPKFQKKDKGKVKPLSREQLAQLTKDINSITDEAQLNKIGELLMEAEKDDEDRDNDLEFDLKTLQPSTQHLLKGLVERFLS
ncbi:Bromodomain containing protein [Histomonas meleagridis]|uniref:Bromodomain containing protein n=1 Tax=Histomonas meleagridis TaxID=135588 RepID=UPI003559E6EE|nr:Bromodomain containing protein [Histomonas meleagridis]KAH0805793.1 Bromodomain containing protein [Histomonas meleagridis]